MTQAMLMAEYDRYFSTLGGLQAVYRIAGAYPHWKPVYWLLDNIPKPN